MRYENAEQFKQLNGYGVNNAWYPRVTKIVAIKAKPALDDFLKEVGDWTAAEDIKTKSAEEGLIIHKVIEKVAVEEEVSIPEEIKPAVAAFQKFKEKLNIVFRPEFLELRFWSPRHRYAGTVDALVHIGGKFGVLDIKTSTGFWPEYNLQTAAYISALQELETKRALAVPQEVQTRWILRVDQHRLCKKCGAKLREKGGRFKIRNSRIKSVSFCTEDKHEWGELEGDVELKEFPYFYKDSRAFFAAKVLWEWENNYWLRQIGYHT